MEQVAHIGMLVSRAHTSPQSGSGTRLLVSCPRFEACSLEGIDLALLGVRDHHVRYLIHPRSLPPAP